MQKMLVQIQASNYNSVGIWDLACDSGWQMSINRIRELLKLDSQMTFDILGPDRYQLRDQPEMINPDIFQSERVNYLGTWIMPNAPATRYDFDFERMSEVLELKKHKGKHDLRYDAVYINDPLLLRHFRAAFFLHGGYLPKFFVHSHFIDNPEAPKFPTEISLWLGQCEAAIKADYNFWQCESAMNVFFESMGKWFQPHIVQEVRAKSIPWDDGYSIEEITQKPEMENIRFSVPAFEQLIKDKTVIFVPNRVGGKGRSSDYTNVGKFMFDVLPQLHKLSKDYIVLAGNPNQKFSNDELQEMCGQYGYVKLTSDSFNRDEYRYIASKSHIALGLYKEDTYGGTAARELIELGCLPVWVDCNEYASLARGACKSSDYDYMCKTDFSDLADILFAAIQFVRKNETNYKETVEAFQNVIRKRCSFEQTTPQMYELMKRAIVG